MKQKDIDRCQRVNLSTAPKDILQTMQLEMPTVNYFFQKDYGGKNKFLKHEDTMLDKALEEEKNQITDISEYISHKGNRWMSYNFVIYFPKAKYAKSFPTSFIYYETYGSCGAFFPIYRPAMKGKKKEAVNVMDGIIIFTSHFFQRMSERTGKAYRSRELIQEFITTKQTHAAQANEDGDVIIKFVGGYGFGKQRCDEPRTLEIRTYLRNEELTPSQRRKCEKVDALAEIVKDGAFMKDVSNYTAYHSNMSEEETIKVALRNIELAKKIGSERFLMLAGMLHITFLGLMVEILGMKTSEISAAQNVFIGNEIQECQIDFLNKYEKFDERTATEEQIEEYKRDLIDTMVACAKKLKLRSMTREAIESRIEKLLGQAQNTANEFTVKQ